MNTKNYFVKRFVRFLFSENNYNNIKLFKILFDFLIGKSYEVSPVLPLLISKEDIVLDIGANMGQFACRFNKIIAKSGHVYSFEPVSFNYSSLKKMKRILGLKNVSIINCAVSDQNGIETIRIPYFSNGLVIGTQSTLNKSIEFKNFQEENVTVKTIDTIVDELNIEKVDFIKSDTEGNEIKVLNGGYKTIISNLPSLYLEINFKDPELNTYYEIGYIPYHYKNKRLSRIVDVQCGDLLLLHKNKLEKLRMALD